MIVLRLTMLMLAVAAMSACSKPEPVNLNLTGSLDDGDTILEADNSLYDDHEVRVASGMTITATMTSTVLDPYLHLVDPSGNQVAQNDDMAQGNTNAQITFVATSTGTWRVLANSFDASGRGAYTLNIVTTAPAQ